MSQCDVQALIHEAQKGGVWLWVEGGRLHFTSSKGALGGDLRRALENNRSALIEQLRGPIFSRRCPCACTVDLPHQLEWWNETNATVVGANRAHRVFKISGPMDTSMLEKALRTVLFRHDLLRARVGLSDGVPSIEFSPDTPLSMEVLDCTASAASESELATTMVWTALEPGILFRSFIAKLSKDRHIVGFVLHHFVGDTWSCMTLGKEIVEEVHAIARQTTVSRQAPLQYSDYLLASEEWLGSVSVAARLAYWKDTMRNAPAICLPGDRDMGPDVTSSLTATGFQIGSPLRRGMARLAGQCKVTMLTLILAAKFVALYRLLGSGDLVLTPVLAGRKDPALLDMVGSTMNLVPLRIALSGNMTFLELISRVSHAQTMADRYEVPWRLILQATAEAGGSIVSPTVNYSFFGETPLSNRHIDRCDVAVDNVQVFPAPAATGRISWHSSHQMYIWDSGRELGGTVNFLSLRYETTTIDALIRSFVGSLSSCVATPRGKISDCLATE